MISKNVSENANREIEELKIKHAEEIKLKEQDFIEAQGELDSVKKAHLEDVKEKDQLFEDQKKVLQTDIESLKATLEKANSEKALLNEQLNV